jgi:GT2 family glycosyltransferase
VSSARTLIIIVNWNKADVLDTMLQSLEASGPREYDAVLVDNASTDNSVALVRQKYPWIHILQNKENLGGTGGFNCGMTYGLQHPNNYEYFWLLDNDVYIHPGAYRALLRPMLDDPQVGMVGSTILLMHDPNHVQEAGDWINWSTGAIERNGSGDLTELPAKPVLEAEFVPACSCLARVTAVRQLGIWDPSYFLLWDDIDWGVRFSRAGWKVVAATGSLVRHESYDNRRARSAAWIGYLSLRNGLYTFRNHAVPGKRLPLFYTAFRLTMCLMDNFRVSGRTEELLALRLAIRDFFANKMGRPPQEVYAKQITSVPGAVAPPAHLNRIAMLVTDNAEMARQMHASLQQSYPGAKIDSVVTNLRPELLAENLPNRKLARVDQLWRRVIFALKLAVSYDAVANPYNQPQYLYEKLAPVVLQFKDETTFEGVPRRLGISLGLILKRPFIWLGACILAVRACLLKPVQVDYFTWRR